MTRHNADIASQFAAKENMPILHQQRTSDVYGASDYSPGTPPWPVAGPHQVVVPAPSNYNPGAQIWPVAALHQVAGPYQVAGPHQVAAAAPQHQVPVQQTRAIEHFNLIQYLMMCTGSGRLYCCPCMFVYLMCGGFGIAEICIIFVFSDNAPGLLMILCVLSGLAFMMCCCMWVCSLIMTQVTRPGPVRLSNCCGNTTEEEDTNYTPLSCLFCLTVIFFVAVAAALGTDVAHGGFPDCSDITDAYCLEFSMLCAMAGVIFSCVLFNVLFYVVFRTKVGYICSKC